MIRPTPGYRPPPRPSIRATCRTALALLTLAPELIARLAIARFGSTPSIGTSEGAEVYGAWCRRALDRLGVRLEVLCAERVPLEGGLILMWNQESHLDHLVLGGAIPRPFLTLYNNEIAAIPLYGSVLRRTGHFHVDRKNEAQWRASIERAALAARGGAAVLVSPEGTRSWDGKLLPMKRGAFLLARDSGKPIVCVTVIGGHRRLPRGAVVVRPGMIRVVFSEPFFGDELRVVETFEHTKLEHAFAD